MHRCSNRPARNNQKWLSNQNSNSHRLGHQPPQLARRKMAATAALTFTCGNSWRSCCKHHKQMVRPYVGWIVPKVCSKLKIPCASHVCGVDAKIVRPWITTNCPVPSGNTIKKVSWKKPNAHSVWSINFVIHIICKMLVRSAQKIEVIDNWSLQAILDLDLTHSYSGVRRRILADNAFALLVADDRNFFSMIIIYPVCAHISLWCVNSLFFPSSFSEHTYNFF